MYTGQNQIYCAVYSTAFGTFFSICSYTVNVLPFLVLVLFIHSFLLPFLCDKWYSYFLFSFSLSPYLFPHFLYCLLSSSLVPFICLKLNLGFVLLPFNIQFIFHCFLLVLCVCYRNMQKLPNPTRQQTKNRYLFIISMISIITLKIINRCNGTVQDWTFSMPMSVLRLLIKR